MVFEPVPRAPTVPASMAAQSTERRWSALRLGELLLVLRVLQRLEEERLVDPALEDRHPEFHAPGDHFAPMHPRLASELRRRQMDRHIPSPPRRLRSCEVTWPIRRRKPNTANCTDIGTVS